MANKRDLIDFPSLFRNFPNDRECHCVFVCTQPTCVGFICVHNCVVVGRCMRVRVHDCDQRGYPVILTSPPYPTKSSIHFCLQESERASECVFVWVPVRRCVQRCCFQSMNSHRTN